MVTLGEGESSGEGTTQARGRLVMFGFSGLGGSDVGVFTFYYFITMFA